jgi:hypothetical protein
MCERVDVGGKSSVAVTTGAYTRVFRRGKADFDPP